MGKSQRRKGACGELEAAAELRDLWPTAKRAAMQARGAASDGCDVEGTPFHIEVKRGKAPPIGPAMAQAKRDTNGRVPLVMTRKDHDEWLVTMRLEDWKRLLAPRAPEGT